MTQVKVSGMGLVSSLGAGVPAVYQAMCGGACGFRDITRFDAEPYAQKRGGQLPEDVEDALRTEFPDDDISIAMMKTAGREAMAEAAMQTAADSRLGLVLATNFGPLETLEWAWRERLDTGTLDSASYEQYGNVVDIVGEFFGCGGPRLQLSMSCASGAAAVSAAVDMLHQGRADSVLVLAYDSLTEYCWCGLSNLRTITTDIMRPFDVHRSGTIFSEGAAAMVLSRDDVPGSALAWIAGAATNNNAFHMTAPRKDAEGSRLVMAEALRQAGMTADDIEHVCAHATSTHANDETEAGALRNLFGERLATMSVAAHKSQLGHLLGAAGLAEAIITVMAMNRGVIPPTMNHSELDPVCAPVDCGPGRARVKSFETAITNSAGIGGNNGALVLTKTPKAGKEQTCVDKIYIRDIAWVLPAGVGHGADLLQHPEWLSQETGGALTGFSAKGYVSSVKGYMDPGGAYQLAAFSLVNGGQAAHGFDERRGICTATRYGACTSAYAFFEQLCKKGPRFASPMIFPHGYANTAGNLAAIEFGMCGPHLVLSGRQSICELLEFALARFSDGTADEMLAGAYEAGLSAALPDGCQVLNGAVALRLAATPSDGDLGVIAVDRLRSGVCAAANETGMVSGLIKALQALL